MKFVKMMLVLPILAVTASPTYAAYHHHYRKHHMSRTVNGATSITPNSGNRKVTRTGGPAGGSSVH